MYINYYNTSLTLMTGSFDLYWNVHVHFPSTYHNEMAILADSLTSFHWTEMICLKQCSFIEYYEECNYKLGTALNVYARLLACGTH